MRLLELTLPTAAENLALDEALLLEAEAGRGGEVFRLWEQERPAVVLGSGCVLRDDVDEDACRAADVPILRRASGGGTVLVGPGCLCFSLVLSQSDAPELSAVRTSYCFILSQIVDALRDVLPEVEIAGISDLASRGFKFSGNSQQRKRSFLLHHGTILHGVDVDLMSRCLRRPERQPEYRAGRAHGDFIRGLDLPREVVRERLLRAWPTSGVVDPPRSEVERLVREKYSREEWIRRR